MRIIETDLDSFGADLVSKCLSTRSERVPTYQGFRHYYLMGAQEGNHAIYNKIYAHIDLLTSFLYSQSTVEFDVAVINQSNLVMEQAELVTNRLNMYFHGHGVADLYAESLLWALVFNSTLVKLTWDGHGRKLKPYFVEPHNFGVLREDVPQLDDQEAFVHCYRISESELRRRIMGLPNAADILRRVRATPQEDQDAFPEPVNRMLIAGTVNMTNSTTRGIVNVPDLIQRMSYKPRSIEDTVEMYELWVWDDERDDYRTITMAEPGIVIYGRKEIGNLHGIKGDQPFVHVCPNPLYDYFYGWSEMANLLKLQDWISRRLGEIQAIMSKQTDPPKALSGWQGITDEKIGALRNAGSWISDPTMNAKIELLAPDVPEDLFKEVMMIQGMFNDVSGLSDVLQGKGESGVRAQAHASVLARLGSARIRKRALTVESSLEQLGALGVRMMKAKDPHRFTMKDGAKFVAAQLTEDYILKVDAHSASPVFVDDHTQLAFSLAKAGAIGPESLIEMTKPPRSETLIKRFEEMQKAKAAQEQQNLAMGITPEGKRAA